MFTAEKFNADEWMKYAKEGVDKYDPDIFRADASFGGTKGANYLQTIDHTKYIGQQKQNTPVFEEKYQGEFIHHF